MFQSEGARLKEEIDSLQYRIKDLENQIKETEIKYEEKLQEKDNHIEYLDTLNKDQREANDKEQAALRQIIEHQKN